MLTQAALKNIATEQLQMLSKLVTAEILLRVGTVVSPPVPPALFGSSFVGQPAPPIPGQRMKLHDFRIGQRAKFTTRGGVPTVITITRINTKSVSGRTDDPLHPGWRVSPGMLQPV